MAIVTVVASAYVLLSGMLPGAAIGGGFVPVRVAAATGQGLALPVWVTPLSATLLHGGVMHLALNLVMLVYCGRQVERSLGATGFAVLYLVGAYAAAAGQWALAPLSPTPMIGASGAISALVAAYALLYGQRRARAIGPVPARLVHAAWLAAAWIGIQLLFGYAGIAGAPVAIGAHIGGFVAGLLLTRPLLLWRYRGA